MRLLSIAVLILGSGSFAAQAADAKAGQAVYDRHCKTCHGPNGAATPNMVKLASSRIPDLRGSSVQLSDAELAKVVTGGKGKMRGDTTVKGKDLNDLVAFIRELKG